MSLVFKFFTSVEEEARYEAISFAEKSIIDKVSHSHTKHPLENLF
jgi:hypothetical protein